jgi:regulator of protease activity HflC (stomatin/prohibitin superfamily)
MFFRETFLIREGQQAALYVDGVFTQALGPGRHRFWRLPWQLWRYSVRVVDVRNRSLTIKGQEILTADKVAIRVSILVYFRVTDVKAALHNVESYEDRIYEDVQLSTRRFLAVKTLDEILKDRNGISDFVRQDVREVAAGYGVEITRADVKDLVFPGNLREIMNRVLETERQSEAMLIEARKKAEAMAVIAQGEREALSARLEADQSLAEQLNKFPVLLRIRELEAYQRIAEKPGQHFYIGLDAGKLPQPESRPTKEG